VIFFISIDILYDLLSSSEKPWIENPFFGFPMGKIFLGTPGLSRLNWAELTEGNYPVYSFTSTKSAERGGQV